ncbi:arylalkylamine N-acetyltransferase-like 2 isoform X2 [Bacillus rossius redtenbacheri]|uniref:arylalkylamine N-acetyltransferase-like 2 isoform X2 n=1 Tax=Bacillus rossius redtenbacheri TaxID=93214 RepID=UPI002FDD3017
MSNEGYSVRIATDCDKDSVVELLRRSFVTEEPLNSQAPAPMDPSELYSLKFLGSGLSLVAAAGDGSVAGVCINTEGTPALYADRSRTKQTSTNPHTRKVLTLLDEAEEAVGVWGRYGVDRFFDVRILAVRRSARGQGLGKALVRRSLQIARERGYQLVHMECTGFYSARIAEQLGMECVFRIAYAEYKGDDGNPVFDVPAPHTELKLFLLKL